MNPSNGGERSVTLDHAFVLLRSPGGADESRALGDGIAAAFEAAGFRSSSHRRHPGQGTENRCFRFDGFMLELLLVVARAEAAAPRTAPLALIARHDDPHASPFGFASRPTDADSRDPPYPHVPYRPAYLPPDPGIAVAAGVPIVEPLWFHLSFLASSPSRRAPPPEASDHPGGFRRVDAVTLATPRPLGERSRRIAGRLGLALDDDAGEHRLTLSFDGGRRGRRFEPDARVPVTIEC